MAAENQLDGDKDPKAKDVLVVENADGTVEVTDPTEPAPRAAAVADPGDDDDDDDHGDGEGSDPDAGTAAAAADGEAADGTDGDVDPDRAAIRARRRKERQDKKDKEAATRRENAELRARVAAAEQRVANMERRATGADIAQLDRAIAAADAEAAHYLGLQAQAVTQANGEASAQATAKYIEAKTKAENLRGVKTQVTRPGPGPSLAPPAEVMRRATEWQSRNQWYDAAGADLDSKIALNVDQALTSEGYKPDTQEFWDELDKRLAKYLPHRVKSPAGKNGATMPGTDTGRGKPTKSVVTGSSRESGARQGASFQLSADRVKALKDAGMWDDIPARNDAIRRYREYDRNAAAARK